VADGLWDGPGRRLGLPVQDLPVVQGRLSAAGDAVHVLDGLNRVFPHRCFRRQHHRVGSIEDGIGHIAGLGPGWTRALNHGLQHLSCGDDGLSLPGAGPDDLLLQHRHILGRYLYPQVAAGNHQAVGDIQYSVEVVYG